MTLVVLLLAAACGGDPEPQPDASSASPSGTTATVPPRTDGVTTTGRGPAPPARGAWFGAYVQATPPTAENRAAVFKGLETSFGRPMDVAQSFRPWGETIPNPTDRAYLDQGKLLMLSWAGTDTRSIALGRYDDYIREQAVAVRDLGVPILLRFRWEMDRPNLAATVHSPADYIAAWKHVRAIFTEVRATNAGWVWCPLATGFASGRAQPFYPGDDQVDWICADVYPQDEYTSFDEIMAPVLAFAREHPRPLIIGELGVRGKDEARRAQWFRDTARSMRAQPQVKGVVYFWAKQEVKPRYDFTFDAPDTVQAYRGLTTDPALRAPTPR